MLNCLRARAFPRRGPLAGWDAPPRGPRGDLLTRAGGMARWARPARVGRRSENRFSSFPVNKKSLFVLVMNPTSINHSKLRGCPKIVKPSLLGSQKCHLSISVVSSQLAVMMIGS